MAQDPVSVVASWIAPACAGAADDLPTTTAPMDDPVIALIAEERRLQALATAASARCDEILATLPEDVQKKRARVSFSGEISGLFRKSFSGEADLQSHLDKFRRLATVRERVLGGNLEAAVADFDREIGLDQALDQLRAGLEEINAIREASGCEAHYREAEALWNQAVEIGDRIFETKPLTLAGAIAMLEWNRDEEYEPLTPRRQTIDTVIAGLRDLQAKGIAPSSASESPDDSTILSLFREWMAASRYAGALYHVRELPDKEVEKQAWAHVNELHRAIFDAPAVGVVGIAIKAYLQIHDSDDGWREDSAAVSRDSQHWQGLLKDAVRFVPELAPLAANALKEPDADDAKAESAAVPEILGFGEPEGQRLD